MKLELKHLAPYLPYKLNVQWLRTEDNSFQISEFNFCDAYWLFNRSNLKPVLRPLSNFGDSDDTRKVHEFIGLGKWCEAYDDYFNAWFDDLANVDKLILQAPQEMFNYFLANHFDVFGLIKNDLAISIHDVVQAEA
ncbi:hypothetical protein H0H26_11385 [Flavobacterium psychrophilum]|uniref:Uncharacterized protein n=2 Tax=Flavobacterium psychrophilum TaxID=96345 RepID=A0A7U2NE48_FLAPS|nr:hypothetical protein H0H26_11385 [Flavobacterium psychrophilum]